MALPSPLPIRALRGGGFVRPEWRDDINATISKRTREAVSPRRGRFCTAEKSRRRPLCVCVCVERSRGRPGRTPRDDRLPVVQISISAILALTRSAEARALATTSPTGPPDASYARARAFRPRGPDGGVRRVLRGRCPRAGARMFSARSRASASRAVSSRASRLARVRPRAAGFEPARWWTARRSAPPRTTSAARCSSAPSAPPAASCSSAAASPTSPPTVSSRSRARSGTTSSATPAWRRASYWLGPSMDPAQPGWSRMHPATGERVAMFSRAPPSRATPPRAPRRSPTTPSPTPRSGTRTRRSCLLDGLPALLRRAPPPGDGGDTVFAACVAAYDALSDEDKARIDDLDAICSYAHHNAKVKKRTPSYPCSPRRSERRTPPCSSPWREPCASIMYGAPRARARAAPTRKMSVRLKDDGACTASARPCARWSRAGNASRVLSWTGTSWRGRRTRACGR